MKRKKIQYRFIDLFAGLGGFHLALSELGHKCVFASELKEDLRKLYSVNFPGTRIEGDITRILPEDIPSHDILCAGFPCQPFSLAGKRQGFRDEKDRGNLFYNILAILQYHRPRFVILENVSNLKGHDGGNTWSTIRRELEAINYHVADPVILSPHQFGIPQHRRRIYIVCEDANQGHLEHFQFPKPTNEPCDINSILNLQAREYQPIKAETRHQLDVWQEFIDLLVEHGDTLPQFPIWAMEFGADYDYVEKAPAFQNIDSLRGKRGKLGRIIDGNDLETCLSQLPNYAQTNRSQVFPPWKIKYIRQNRELYARNKEWLDRWLLHIAEFDNSFMKMEWNCGSITDYRLDHKIIQFRASGIRVKLPNYTPALNLVGSQVPIIPWIELPPDTVPKGEPSRGRYLTVSEAATLQGMGKLHFSGEDYGLTTARCYEALGNAVNVDIIQKIAKNLLQI